MLTSQVKFSFNLATDVYATVANKGVLFKPVDKLLADPPESNVWVAIEGKLKIFDVSTMQVREPIEGETASLIGKQQE